MERRQKRLIVRDLEKKIVFLVGPRQVGKTWLAKDIAREFRHATHLNWDSAGDRRVIRAEGWLKSTDLLVLDELHKMKGWKGFLKGVFDTRPAHLRILVTGSARLDFARQAGPSLAGRFFVHRLLPFSPAEVGDPSLARDIDRFMRRGGFPEPFLAEEDVDADRWRSQYVDGLVREDAPDFERIQDLRALRTVLDLLRERVGTPVSYQSLSVDAGVAPNTVRKYVRVLEALYIVFRVAPWTGSIARSLLKNPKLYFYDTGMVRGDPGAVFENFAAVCLLKQAMSDADRTGRDHALHYIRTKDGREVDFCVVRDGRPAFLVEAKHADVEPSANLARFCRALGVPGVQVVKEARRESVAGSIEVRMAERFFADPGVSGVRSAEGPRPGRRRRDGGVGS
jgi:predicted AAA+ superfamily ATPase